MSTNFESLPGIEMPVAEVTREIERVWKADGIGTDAASARASQLNLVIHTGLDTTEEEVQILFDTAVQFGQKTPCRIILLCPRSEDSGRDEERLRGKLYTQCFVGESLREKCCCEALIMSYEPCFSEYLQNQITLWLESDLPGYLWFHRVPAQSISDKYLDLSSKFQRVVFDSSVDGKQMHDIAWPDTGRVKDFARSRLLKILQSLGQFLSSYQPIELVEGLELVEISIQDSYSGEGNNLMDWMRCCAQNCCEIAGVDASNIAFKLSLTDSGSKDVASVQWSYLGDKFYSWSLNQESRMATTEADFGRGVVHNTQIVTKMPPVDVLSEALFFTTT